MVAIADGPLSGDRGLKVCTPMTRAQRTARSAAATPSSPSVGAVATVSAVSCRSHADLASRFGPEFEGNRKYRAHPPRKTCVCDLSADWSERGDLNSRPPSDGECSRDNPRSPVTYLVYCLMGILLSGAVPFGTVESRVRGQRVDSGGRGHGHQADEESR